MDFRQDGDNMGYGGGGGNLATGIALGNSMNRRDDDRGTYIWAVIVFIIFVVIALVFLAFMRRDEGRKDYPTTDIGAILTPLIAAKSMDCDNGKSSAIDKFEIMQKIEHSEDRARETQTQQEIGHLGKEFMQMGFGLSGQIHNTEKTELENFAKLEHQLGIQNLALTQLLQKENNRDIIQGVLAQLTMGIPCSARC